MFVIVFKNGDTVENVKKITSVDKEKFYVNELKDMKMNWEDIHKIIALPEAN